MKLYDLYTLDGEFVDTVTREEAKERFDLSNWGLRTKIGYIIPIDGKYYLDDLEEDAMITKCGDKKLLAQFDLVTKNLRKILGLEEEYNGRKL